jgi:photosystem II stability/assembly factor-like uncharacterized protein
VFAIALPAAPALPVSSLFRSLDGGVTYPAAILAAPAGFTISGVESATSDPMTVYATLAKSEDGTESALARSADGGDTWSMFSLTSQLGAVTTRLVAVDPRDPRHMFLRLVSGPGVVPAGEALAMTTDGGVSFTRPLELPDGNILGFARLPDGTWIAAGSTTSVGQAIYRSEDDGVTFTSMAVDFHPRGLGARDGVLFVAANDIGGDGFALASSTDGGKSWRPRLSFADISGIRSCVKAACQVDCANLSGITLFAKSVCTAKDGAGCAVADGVTGFGSAVGMLIAGALIWLSRRPRKPHRGV